ncbi:MAG: hypothetical protein AB7L66_03605 [Gemmatimonadales bacterium]
MTHLTVEQLLATREPGLEPGVRGWREHLESCADCRHELDRLDQRVARLKALPTLRPSRDLFGSVRFQAARERRAARVRRVAIGGVALAASLVLTVLVTRPSTDRTLVAADAELAEVMSRSQQLETALSGFDPDRQVVDGRAVAVTSSLEERLARVDRQIEAVGLLNRESRQDQMLRLWRERVGLLDALVDVHLTGARYVGF